MNKKRYIVKTLIIIFIFTTLYGFADFKEDLPQASPEYSGYGIAGTPDYQMLIDNPQRIVKKYNKTNKNFFSITSDYHILVPFSVEKLSNLLSDIDSSEDVFPRMAVSDLYYHAEFPEEIFYQKVVTDFETLGFGKEYEYTLKVRFDEKSEDCFKMRWELNKSADNTFSVFEGSWYCEEVVFENKKYSYLRNYTETEFINPGFITVFAVKHFSEGEIKRAFKSISAALQ